MGDLSCGRRRISVSTDPSFPEACGEVASAHGGRRRRKKGGLTGIEKKRGDKNDKIDVLSGQKGAKEKKNPRLRPEKENKILAAQRKKIRKVRGGAGFVDVGVHSHFGGGGEHAQIQVDKREEAGDGLEF